MTFPVLSLKTARLTRKVFLFYTFRRAMKFPFTLAENREFDAVGFGTNAVDFLIVTPEYPKFNSKIELDDYTQLAGGEIASTMAGLRRLGLKTAYVGRFGKDAAGDGRRRYDARRADRRRADADRFYRHRPAQRRADGDLEARPKAFLRAGRSAGRDRPSNKSFSRHAA
jgi:hypothetical protein